MTKIAGNVVGIPNPQSDWSQFDATKADFIKNKPTVLTEDDVLTLIGEHGGGSAGVGISDIYATVDDTGGQTVVIINLTDGRTLSFGIPFGKDGKGIQSMAYYDTMSDGQVGIYVWYTDGTVDQIWIPGLKGENGADGVGIESIEMLPMGDEYSNIIVKLTDGTENFFPVYNGKDAYQVATQNGFEGSEEEWLASLKGEKGDKGDSLTLTVTDDGNGNVKLTIE